MFQLSIYYYQFTMNYQLSITNKKPFAISNFVLSLKTVNCELKTEATGRSA